MRCEAGVPTVEYKPTFIAIEAEEPWANPVTEVKSTLVLGLTGLESAVNLTPTVAFAVLLK